MNWREFSNFTNQTFSEKSCQNISNQCLNSTQQMILDWKRGKREEIPVFPYLSKGLIFNEVIQMKIIFCSSVKQKQTNQDYALPHSGTWKNLSSRKTKADSAAKPVLEIKSNVITYSNWGDLKIVLSLILYINLKCRTFTLL